MNVENVLFTRDNCAICGEYDYLENAIYRGFYNGKYYNGWFDNFQLCESCVDKYFACTCKMCVNIRHMAKSFDEWQMIYEHTENYFDHV